ncbi:hypothetical protein [Tanticharoenia sakaeratensis]|uniref:hypothetical protein n=1 Tax=Tanticharoenia sakaeratensis TaxID=444053 RepID=UPI00066216AD|nr:hypothetical protein [Tanticharoenia sakaeratensis]
MTARLLLACAAILPLSLAPGPARADAVQTDVPPASPQAVVDQLVQEPWRYDGTATGVAALESTTWRNGRQPTRILIGLHPVAPASVSDVPGPARQQLAGEIVALDSDSRPVAAAPIGGTIDRGAGPRANTAACELKTHLAADLVLHGVCGPQLLSGSMSVEEPTLARVLIDIGAASPPMTAGEYWLGPLR